MSKIRVLIADDHRVVREGLASVLSNEPDLHVTALCADGEHALRAAREEPPHVAVVDMRMPKLGGIALIKRLRECCDETKVLVLSMYEDERYTRSALDAGAHGYVSKRAGVATLLSAIRTLAEGSSFVDQQLRPVSAASADPSALSAREHEVMRMVALGHTSRAIAEALGISKSSVDTYRARVFQKLGVENRAELLARIAGWPGGLTESE